jgi:hypothetical protein
LWNGTDARGWATRQSTLHSSRQIEMLHSAIMNPEQPNLEFSVIEKPLDLLLSALENKIEREWPSRLGNVQGAQHLFLLTLKTANVTYRSVRYLCADKPPDPARKLEYSISVSPLNRTILDNLLTLMFVMEDLPVRCRWYFKADWRETRLELERHRVEYGNYPDWQDWLGRFTAYSDGGIKILGLSSAEIATPSTIPSWPNPGKMPNYGLSPKSAMPPNRAFMKYLNDWFYADMSQQAHLGGSGLAKRAGFLLYDPGDDTERGKKLKKYKYAQVGQTVAIILALASEIEAHFHFGLRERASYVWGLVAPVIVVARELYDKRYADLLTV